MTPAITSFKNGYAFLSNFYPVRIEMDGEEYPSVEHAYVAAKTLDLNIRTTIRGFEKPGQAKLFGKKIELRADWEDVKLSIMHNLLVQKFFHQHLRTWLIATGDAELIEGNWWGDTFWGVCNGVGQNHLGKMLMRIREGLSWAKEST
jgi:ribA/ribD-fused uncharacterized protein